MGEIVLAPMLVHVPAGLRCDAEAALPRLPGNVTCQGEERREHHVEPTRYRRGCRSEARHEQLQDRRAEPCLPGERAAYPVGLHQRVTSRRGIEGEDVEEIKTVTFARICRSPTSVVILALAHSRERSGSAVIAGDRPHGDEGSPLRRAISYCQVASLVSVEML